MHFFSYETSHCVKNDGGGKKNSAQHGERFGIEAAFTVKQAGKVAVYQQSPACQRAEQRHTHADLLPAGMLDCYIILKM
jgi:hypothetical protein